MEVVSWNDSVELWESDVLNLDDLEWSVNRINQIENDESFQGWRGRSGEIVKNFKLKYKLKKFI